jgi:hypothetical protein
MEVVGGTGRRTTLALMRLLDGFVATQLLYVAAKLGIADVARRRADARRGHRRRRGRGP